MLGSLQRTVKQIRYAFVTEIGLLTALIAMTI